MKKVTGLLFALSMLAPLASCGGNSQGDDFVPSLDTNRDCSITVVGHYSNFQALEAEFGKFNVYYPNVKLSYLKLDNYKSTLANKLDGDDKPNIFFSESLYIYDEEDGKKKYESIVSHMEDLSDPSLKLDLSIIREGLLNRDTPNKLLLVPVFSRTYGMLVNEDIFKKEGLSIPKKWSELFTTCDSFIEKEYVSPMMGYSKGSSSCLMNTIAYPSFIADIANNETAIELANDLDVRAGEYTRDALTKVKELIDEGCVNLSECDKIGNNYDKVIFRFFEGDVPMMICTADTVSGTSSRESQSEAYSKNPFTYSFHPLPLNELGGYFIDSPSLELSVNKDCDNLDMTNEFMRFLLRPNELNAMAKAKGLITPVNGAKFDKVYAAFNDVASERTICPQLIGVRDNLATQIRIASYRVGKGEIDIDTAISSYGTFKD